MNRSDTTHSKIEFVPMEDNFHWGTGPKLLIALLLVLFYLVFAGQAFSKFFFGWDW